MVRNGDCFTFVPQTAVGFPPLITVYIGCNDYTIRNTQEYNYLPISGCPWFNLDEIDGYRAVKLGK